MKPRAVSVVLIIVIILGVFFSVTQVNGLSRRISGLEADYVTLQAGNDELQNSYNTLEADHVTMLGKYDSLEASYRALISDYNALDAEYRTVTAKYSGLESDYAKMRSDYDIARNQVGSLQTLINQYQSVPHSYYSSEGFYPHANTYEQLRDFLTVEFTLPRDYELNVFDCSESAAYVEWALENAGLDAEIVVGPAPGDPKTYHAWVIAHTQEFDVAIEATILTNQYDFTLINRIPGVIYVEDDLVPEWRAYYYGYDRKFQNIYSAIRDFGGITEWNWWDAI
ncbi:MAG: hypothetical protein C4555_03900 [Dehalococcoidia bacterium]|jgi:hypothetical protein|nr:MAG: hypothetical protein C4555_03900 [Dehalococcoidia bacterium]